MKVACLLLLALNMAALAAAYLPSEAWAYKVCGNAFGACDYPLILAFGAAVWVGMFIMLKEMN
jgi:hypothetical protein